VRSWGFANSWVFDHHTARFSINGWIWLVQRLFGTHPNGMYLTPLLASLAQVPLLYACGRALGVPAAGFAACLALLLFDPALDASSQLLPGIFQATYVLAALHALLCFARAPEQGRRWLCFAGAWLFAAYLAVVTTVYVFPGVALGAGAVRRSLRDAVWVFAVFAGLFVLETVGYALWSPYPFGQFQLILRTHTDVKPTTFLGLFERFLVLPPDWQIALAGWLLCGLAWLALRRSRQLPETRAPGSYALWLVPASGLAGMTLGVKHLNPIIPATDFSIRYCDVLMPLLALGLGCTSVWLARLVGRGRRLAYVPALGVLALLAATTGAWLFVSPARRVRPPGHRPTVARAERRDLAQPTDRRSKPLGSLPDEDADLHPVGLPGGAQPAGRGRAAATPPRQDARRIAHASLFLARRAGPGCGRARDQVAPVSADRRAPGCGTEARLAGVRRSGMRRRALLIHD
jgi:hypothetical protein